MKKDQPTTNFKSVSSLIEETAGTRRHIKLSNGFYTPVTSKTLRDLSKTMVLYQKQFIGEYGITNNFSYIEIY